MTRLGLFALAIFSVLPFSLSFSADRVKWSDIFEYDESSAKPSSKQTAYRLNKTDGVNLASVSPVVIKTFPAAGDEKVNSKTTEIRVTFSKQMRDATWSWTVLDFASFPRIVDDPRYLEDGRTCVLPVKLEPGKTYALWLNTNKHQRFMDTNGVPAVPYLLVFKTAD